MGISFTRVQRQNLLCQKLLPKCELLRAARHLDRAGLFADFHGLGLRAHQAGQSCESFAVGISGCREIGPVAGDLIGNGVIHCRR